MLNALTVDLEDWFCVSNMAGIISPDSWGEQEHRVELPTGLLLDRFRSHGTRATFFTLGWIAERHPQLIEQIHQAGHEISLHGYKHIRADAMDQTELIRDITKSREITSAILPGVPLPGYRAPSFSIGPHNAWALDTLAALGFRYDSSVNPVSGHPDYGWPGFRRDIHKFPSGLVEVPMTPWLGGGYFRLLPYALSKHIVRRANAAGRPAIFYLHPWEIDADQPRIKLPLQKRFRHYVNLDRTLKRLELLLTEFRFAAVGDVLDANGF